MQHDDTVTPMPYIKVNIMAMDDPDGDAPVVKFGVEWWPPYHAESDEGMSQRVAGKLLMAVGRDLMGEGDE